MSKSFAGIKKFLSPRHSTSSIKCENSINNINMSQTKKFPNLPDLLVENEDLKQKISQLEKDKKLLEIIVYRRTIDQNSTIQRVSNESDEVQISRRSNKNSFSRHEQIEQIIPQAYQVWRNSLGKGQQKPNLRFGIQISSEQVKELLKQEQQKNRKLTINLMKLNLKIQHNAKQKKQMLQIIQQLRDKLRQSTQYILKMQRKANSEQKQSLANKIQAQLKQRELAIQKQYMLKEKSYDSRANVDDLITQYSKKLNDYYETKSENYKLRDHLANMFLNNAVLKQKTRFCTKAIDHLWVIKNTQLQNIKLCLKELKGQKA